LPTLFVATQRYQLEINRQNRSSEQNTWQSHSGHSDVR